MANHSEGVMRIHDALVQAVADYARAYDLSAAEIAAYLDDAAKGMKVNAAFALKGADLAEAVLADLDA